MSPMSFKLVVHFELWMSARIFEKIWNFATRKIRGLERWFMEKAWSKNLL